MAFRKQPRRILRNMYACSGKVIYMRSSWEVAFAKYLDANRITWLYEPKCFHMGRSAYLPDFYLPQSNTWVEIKGIFTRASKRKMIKFFATYPNERLYILFKADLQRLGILK